MTCQSKISVHPGYSHRILPRFVPISRNGGSQTLQGTDIILTRSHRDKTYQPTALMKTAGISLTGKCQKLVAIK